MEKDNKNLKYYSNGEITVVWNSSLCTHVAYCFTELPEVFDPTERPWINAKGASTQKIIDQVNRCPTDALTFFYNDDKKNPNILEEMENQKEMDTIRIEIVQNGPAIIKGKSILIKKEGIDKGYDGVVALCRCGKSKNKPLCDGSHYSNTFE